MGENPLKEDTITSIKGELGPLEDKAEPGAELTLTNSGMLNDPFLVTTQTS